MHARIAVVCASRASALPCRVSLTQHAHAGTLCRLSRGRRVKDCRWLPLAPPWAMHSHTPSHACCAAWPQVRRAQAPLTCTASAPLLFLPTHTPALPPLARRYAVHKRPYARHFLLPYRVEHVKSDTVVRGASSLS